MWFEKAKALRVLMVGDSIIDQYCYVQSMARSPKEYMIPTAFKSIEVFEGGTQAAARHVMNFCDEVHVVLGAHDTIKTRYVEESYVRKLFEVHHTAVAREAESVISFADYDCVMLLDFGHGCIDDDRIDEAEFSSKFLAVNAQTNASNYGYNLITKYQRADYIVVDEPEARLALQDRDSSVEMLCEQLHDHGFNTVIITRGKSGACGYSRAEGFYSAPAYTESVVDTMGAGDAFFAVTAPLCAAGAPLAELVRVGNAAGAIKTKIVGHRRSVGRDDLERFLTGARFV